MSKKSLRTKAWPVTICAVVLLTALFLYWRAGEHSTVMRVVTTSKPATPYPAEVSTPVPSTAQTVPEPAATAPVEEVSPLVAEPAPDAEEVARAIGFLENMEKQTAPDTREESFDTVDEKQQPKLGATSKQLFYFLHSAPTFRKITMQVHRAVFNIPIEEKDLHIPD